MREIVECIPNFSEGRRSEVVDEIVAAIKSVPGAVLLDRESDPDHNRSVITFVAPPNTVVDAAIAAARRAAELIDLNRHTGEHPRMGATDVIPFVPIAGVTMEDCVRLAGECGERMWRELGIPVYLYEKAATRPERENLAAVRKGQFEGIRDEIATNEARRPDYGEARVHPTAGITAVGARPPLIAYNVNLGTADIEIANKIARAVRHQTGGLRYVKALGFELKDRGIVQVSMNMVNYEGTPLFRAFEMIKREAERYGVPVIGSEIVGLVPQRALNAAADFYLQLENFSEEQILEHRLARAMEAEAAPQISDLKSEITNSVGNFAELVAAGTPTPGGGSVAAYAGALAASLGQMMCNLTVGKPKYAAAEPRVLKIRDELDGLAKRLRELIAEDAASFEGVLQAYRLPKESEEQKAERQRRIEEAGRVAVNVPMETARLAAQVAGLLVELSKAGNPNAMPDVAMAGQLARAAVKGAHYNVGVNLNMLPEDEARRIRDEITRLVKETEGIADEMEKAMLAKMGA
ncbi:MAG TPA: glutamate formimidoyltransferase [Blastocatellia bacterium]|nr:glutamate formimidoyltransferase [Blastocatellia bacterium]